MICKCLYKLDKNIIYQTSDEKINMVDAMPSGLQEKIINTHFSSNDIENAIKHVTPTVFFETIKKNIPEESSIIFIDDDQLKIELIALKKHPKHIECIILQKNDLFYALELESTTKLLTLLSKEKIIYLPSTCRKICKNTCYAIVLTAIIICGINLYNNINFNVFIFTTKKNLYHKIEESL